jgi:DNA helicase-2/ATP-dependent DNA helicase PcrA
VPQDASTLLTGLDDAQRRAASALEGPVRITAVAGAGKTRTITRRIAYGCASSQWDAQRTVAVTFSVKAANEMKQRLNKLGVGSVTAATFHSLALSQLREVWSEITDSYFPQVIADPSEILEAGVERETDLVGASPRELRDLLAEVNWTKVSLIAPKEYPRVCAAFHRIPPAGLSPEQMAALITDYERQKSDQNLIDFNDILLILCHVIEESDEVAARIRSKIGWLTVDEYQDVSPLQHRVMRAWLGKNTNICVVGDPAQTIYSFAGATSYYLLDFDREFEGLSADVRLDHDYRSTPQIVDCANSILSQSENASDYLPLVSSQENGPKVGKRVYATDAQEAEGVARAIRKLLDSGVEASEIAVLSRINSQTRVVCDACDRFEIPYMLRRVVGQGMDETSFSKAVRAGVSSGEIASLNTELMTISTIHAAKGLEWDHVFIIGVSEGLLPFGAGDNEAQIEEERRLLYVGVTRGRRQVELSFARKKDAYAPVERVPSRFLGRG